MAAKGRRSQLRVTPALLSYSVEDNWPQSWTRDS